MGGAGAVVAGRGVGQAVGRPAAVDRRDPLAGADWYSVAGSATRVRSVADGLWALPSLAARWCLVGGPDRAAGPGGSARGDASTFIDRSDVRAWAAAIRALYREGPERARKTEAARARSTVLTEQSRRELALWVEAI